MFLVIGAAVVGSSGAAIAGTRGGLYDMQRMINEGHPFATSAPAAPAYTPPPARFDAGAPPPPPPAAPARMAQRSPAPDYDEGGFMDGFFDRLYFSIGGYYHAPDDIDASVTGAGSASIENDSGFMVNAALGKYVFDSMRAELELAVRQADYDRVTAGGASTSGSGDINLTTVMVNAYYDFNLGWPVTPYVGGGVGVGILDGTDVSVGARRVSGPDSTEFAYQGILGAMYQVSPQWSLGLEGRYLGAGSDYSSIDGGVLVRFNM
jgi:opacity protein-like surface antigen